MIEHPRSVGELLADPPAPDVQVAVRGHLLDEGGHAVACDRLAETFPPQPGGATVRLTGIDVAALDGVATTGDTTWTTSPHVVVGRLSGGTLDLTGGGVRREDGRS